MQNLEPQTRLGSLLEATLNTATGFVLSLLVWQWVVVPIWEFEVTTTDNLVVTGLFTILSIGRSYFWRRFFATQAHQFAEKAAGALRRLG